MSKQVISYTVRKYRADVEPKPSIAVRVCMIIVAVIAIVLSFLVMIVAEDIFPRHREFFYWLPVLTIVLCAVIIAVINSAILSSRSKKEGLSKDYIRLPKEVFYTFAKNENKPNSSKLSITSGGDNGAIAGWAMFGALGMVLFGSGRRPINFRTSLGKITSIESVVGPLDKSNLIRNNKVIFAISWAEGATVYKLTTKNGLTILIEPTEELLRELQAINYANF